MIQKTVISKNDKYTEKLGEELASSLKPSDIVLLQGDLGAGKTTFVRGVARGLNVKSRVVSPTFVLIRSHEGKLNHESVKLNHIDLYRVVNEDEIEELGLDEVFEDFHAVTIIEWGNRTNKIRYSWEVTFEVVDDKRRQITI